MLDRYEPLQVDKGATEPYYYGCDPKTPYCYDNPCRGLLTAKARPISLWGDKKTKRRMTMCQSFVSIVRGDLRLEPCASLELTES